MNPSLRIKVHLLVGNHLLCKSLIRIIRQRSDIFVTEEAVDFSDPASIIGKSESDVVLVGPVCATALLSRPYLRGISDLNPKAQILVIGMSADEGTFLRAVRAGVRGYLLNEALAADVITAIRAIARGEAVCPPQFCRTLFDTVSGAREFVPAVRKMGRRLTRRQQQLLPMLARGLTNKEIASLLNLSEQTVKNHIHRMLRKLGASDRLHVLEVASAEDFPN